MYEEINESKNTMNNTEYNVDIVQCKRKVWVHILVYLLFYMYT